MIASLVVLTANVADEQFARLNAELSRRCLSYTLVFVRDQAAKLELIVLMADGSFKDDFKGEQIFPNLNKVQIYVEAQKEAERSEMADKILLLKKLIAYGRGESPELTDDECQMLARTREELKSERVRDSLARWAEHFKPNLDEIFTLGWSSWADSPGDQQAAIALFDQLLGAAKSAITRLARA